MIGTPVYVGNGPDKDYASSTEFKQSFLKNQPKNFKWHAGGSLDGRTAVTDRLWAVPEGGFEPLF